MLFHLTCRSDCDAGERRETLWRPVKHLLLTNVFFIRGEENRFGVTHFAHCSATVCPGWYPKKGGYSYSHLISTQ